jgi:hypothetical protein
MRKLLPDKNHLKIIYSIVEFKFKFKCSEFKAVTTFFICTWCIVGINLGVEAVQLHMFYVVVPNSICP